VRLVIRPRSNMPPAHSRPNGSAFALTPKPMAGARRLKDWIAGIELDALTLPLGLGVLLLLLAAAALGMLFGMRAQRRRDRQSREDPVAVENAHELTIARWVEEGQRLFNVWQERVAHVTELQARLDAMAQEMDQLRAQVSRIDDLRAETSGLSHKARFLLLEQSGCGRC